MSWTFIKIPGDTHGCPSEHGDLRSFFGMAAKTDVFIASPPFLS